MRQISEVAGIHQVLNLAKKYGTRLLQVGNDLWICSYPLIAVILLNVIVRFTEQGTELTSALNSYVSNDEALRQSAGAPEVGSIQLLRMFLAVGFCSICIYLASYAALESRNPIASSVPLWLAILCSLSAGGVFLNQNQLEALTWLLAVVAFLLPFLPRNDPHWILPRMSSSAIIVSSLALLCLGTLTLIWTLISPVALPRMLSTWPVVYIAIGFWTLLGTLVFIALPRWCGFPSFWLVPVVLVFAFSSCNDNHVLRVGNGFADGSRAGNLINQEAEQARIELAFRNHLFRWLSEHCTKLHCNLEVIAIEGGGLRAAYWAAKILQQLDLDQKSHGGFSKDTFAVSAVSGGSIGATAYYAALQKERVLTEDQQDLLGAFLSDDYLSPIISSFVFGGVVQALWPGPIPKLDRAWAFEDAFADSWNETRVKNRRLAGDAFNAVFPPTATTEPELFLNATNVESGKRFLISQLLLPYQDGGREMYNAFDRDAPYVLTGLQTKEAVHLSSRFSLVSPAATLYAATHPSGSSGVVPRFWGRVVDGGYYDNTGLTTAIDIIEAVKTELGRCRHEHPSSCLYAPVISLTYISDNPVGNDALDNPEIAFATSRWPSDLKGVPAASEVRSVIDTHFVAQNAAGIDTQIRRLQQSGIDMRNVYPISLARLAMLENSKGNDKKWCRYFAAWRPALGWWLSKRSRVDMNILLSQVKAHQQINGWPSAVRPDRITAIAKSCAPIGAAKPGD